MNSLIISFQEDMLTQEMTWHNIETSYLVERTNEILSQSMVLREEESKKGVGTKIKDTAIKIYNAIVNTLESIGTFFKNMFEKLSTKVKNWTKKLPSLKGKKTSKEVVVPDVDSVAKKAAAGEEGEAKTKKLRVTDIGGFVKTCLGWINKLFASAKDLFNRSKKEGEEGKAAAKKAEAGDSSKLTEASEKKKKVSLRARLMSMVFTAISKIFSAMASVCGTISDKAEAGMDKVKSRKNKERLGSVAIGADEKAKANQAKADKYADKAASLKEESSLEEISANPFLLENRFENFEEECDSNILEETEELVNLDEELEDLEKFLDSYED